MKASLIAQRQVYDAIIAKRGILKIGVTSKMIGYVSQSYSRYLEGLKREKEQISDEGKKAKDKKMATECIKILRHQRLQVKQSMKNEIQDIDRNILDLEMSKK